MVNKDSMGHPTKNGINRWWLLLLPSMGWTRHIYDKYICNITFDDTRQNNEQSKTWSTTMNELEGFCLEFLKMNMCHLEGTWIAGPLFSHRKVWGRNSASPASRWTPNSWNPLASVDYPSFPLPFNTKNKASSMYGPPAVRKSMMV